MFDIESCIGLCFVETFIYLVHMGIIIYMFTVLISENIFLKRYVRLISRIFQNRLRRHQYTPGNVDGVGIQKLGELTEKMESLNWTDEDICSKVRNLLGAYTGGQEDWEQHCTFGRNSYSRFLIHPSPKFQLILLVFKPLRANKPHNHGNSLCWFKVLKGRLIEKQFKKPLNDGYWKWKCIQQIGTNEMNANPGLPYAHCCENPSEVETAVSLAVYFPPTSHCSTFDLVTGESSSGYGNFDSPDHYGQRSSSFCPLYVILAALLLVVYSYNSPALVLFDCAIVAIETGKHFYLKAQRLGDVETMHY